MGFIISVYYTGHMFFFLIEMKKHIASILFIVASIK